MSNTCARALRPEPSINLLAKFVPSARGAVQHVVDFAKRLVQREANGAHGRWRHAPAVCALSKRLHQTTDSLHQLGEVFRVGFPGLILGESRIKLDHAVAVRLEIGLPGVRDAV